MTTITSFHQLLLITVVMSLLSCAQISVIAKAIMPQTTLSSYFYENVNCSGTPYIITNFTIGECGQEGIAYYPSIDGEYVYMFEALDRTCDQSPPIYSTIIRFDTLPMMVSTTYCSQYVITNPEYAPSLPLEFPPADWLRTIAYLNETTGQRASTCTTSRYQMIASNMACYRGRQIFCDGQSQVGAAFLYYPDDPTCQGEPMEVESESFAGQENEARIE